MIGVTRFARFAGFAGLPAVLPAFAKAAWLGIAPVLTFQSVDDSTVSTRAILSALYARLPANGSEIVLFGVNRTSLFGPLMRTTSYTAVDRLLPTLPQDFRITIVSHAGVDDPATVERRIEAGATEAVVRPLGIDYSKQVFSLSHVAIPCPVSDSLYGYDPAPRAEFGLNLGAVMARGERGALIMNLESLFRIASNPFFPYLIERIEEGLTPRSLDAAHAADARLPTIDSESPGPLLVHQSPDTGHAPMPHADADPLPFEFEDAQPNTELGP